MNMASQLSRGAVLIAQKTFVWETHEPCALSASEEAWPFELRVAHELRGARERGLGHVQPQRSFGTSQAVKFGLVFPKKSYKNTVQS